MTPDQIDEIAVEAYWAALAREGLNSKPIADAIRAALRERDAAHEIALKKVRADALNEAIALAENDASYQERGDPREMALRTLAGRLRALLEEAGK